MGKFARGIADDFLTTHYLASTAPVLIVPAMNGAMWRHPAVLENVAILKTRGHHLLQPEKGLLACGDVDEGRLPEPVNIAEEALRLLGRTGSLQDVRVLVTAGPTREALDPVRFLTNRSSGKMGYAIAEEALRRGARVTLISGPTTLEPPRGAAFVPVRTAAEMEGAVRAHFADCQVLVMAAAVADYKPVQILESKRKKGTGEWRIELVHTADILSGLKPLRKPGQLVCGFAAETEDLRTNALKKLEEKGLDLIAANDVSRPAAGFDTDRNALTLFWKDGREERVKECSKSECAKALWDAIQETLRGA
jgi:phosphopantothenoylcysteine decarboxylase/phosphopantothenate--cysteine ligase